MLKRFSFFILLLTGVFRAQAQMPDLIINPTIVAPTSGCLLSASSTVTVYVVNVGPQSTFGTNVDISLSVDGGPPIVESSSIPIASGSSYLFSFATPVDLSGCQIHTLDFIVTNAFDINNANNTMSTTVTSDCPPSPGGLTMPDTVCQGINSGNLISWGNFGIIDHWEFSDDNGSTWTSVPNTTNTQPYLNISNYQLWFVVINSLYGICASDSTAIDSIKIVPQTVPGTLPADFDICDNGNWGTIDLTGNIGTVLNWEYSDDNGATWNTVWNTTNSLSYTNLMDTFMYQVQVQNFMCPPAYTAPVTLTLIPGSDAGSIVGELLVCNFENDSSLECNPITGSVIDWIVSYDNATTFSNTGVADSIYAYNGLNGYTVFGAIVQEGSCPVDTVLHSIVVLPLAVTATPTTTIFAGDSIQLNASGGVNFSWFPDYFITSSNTATPTVTPEVTTTYYVQITDINGCIDTASLVITVVSNPNTIIIPNLITPNGDTYNDILVIPNIDTYPLNELIIFNAYGQVIYSASPYNNDWDGQFNGDAVPDGTYFYILNLNDPAFAPEPFQGVLTILGNE